MNQQPNIVLLLADTLRYDHLSCYGYERNTTPFIDSLAQESTLFEQAYSNSIYSLPAYASFFTGAYPSEHGAANWGATLDTNPLIDRANDRGYSTYCVSPHMLSGEYGLTGSFDKSHWIQLPWRDASHNEDQVLDMIANEYSDSSGWRKYLTALQLIVQNRSAKSIKNGIHRKIEFFRRNNGYWRDDGAEDVVNRATQLVSQSETPFLLFANFIEPHFPYRPPREYIYHYLDQSVSIGKINSTLGEELATPIFEDAEKYENGRDLLISLYDAEIRYLDSQVQRLYNYLQNNRLLKNTVICVFSDHGDLFGEWGLWGHRGKIHHNLAHVPLIIRYPWSENRRIAKTTDLASLHDHIVDIMSPEMDNQIHMPSNEAFVEYHGFDTQHDFLPWERYSDATQREWGTYQASVVSGDHMLIKFVDSSKLYDIQSDPICSVDISSEYPDVKSELESVLIDELGKPENNHHAYREYTETNISEEAKERLKKLGYTG